MRSDNLNCAIPTHRKIAHANTKCYPKRLQDASSRRLAANVAKLPELLSKRQRLAAWSIEEFRHK